MTVQKYIFGELTKTFLFIFLCLSLVVFMGFSLRQLMKFEGVGIALLGSLITYMAGYIFTYTIPVSLLLASVVVYRGMASNNEILALRASGISRYSLTLPVLLLALVLCLFLLYVQHMLLPDARFQKRNIDATELSSILMSTNQRDRMFQLKDTLFRFHSSRNGELTNVHVVELFPDEAPQKWFVARRGRFTKLPTIHDPTMELRLYDVTVTYWENKNKREKHQILNFNEEPFIYRRNLRKEMGIKKRRLRDMNIYHIKQLARDPDKPPESLLSRYDTKDIKTVLHKRYALALAPIALLFIGIPVALTTGESTRIRGVGIGTLPALVLFYPAIFIAERLCMQYDAEPLWVFWPPLLLMALIGFIMFKSR